MISDVVSERHVAEKFRYHIGNTDVVSENTDVVSEKSDVVSVFPMWYPLRAFSHTTSEIISNRV